MKSLALLLAVGACNVCTPSGSYVVTGVERDGGTCGPFPYATWNAAEHDNLGCGSTMRHVESDEYVYDEHLRWDYAAESAHGVAVFRFKIYPECVSTYDVEVHR